MNKAISGARCSAGLDCAGSRPASIAFVRGLATALAVLLVAGARTAQAQDSAALRRPVPLTGTVTDSVSGERLANAVVQLLPEADPAHATSAKADSNGEFRFPAVAPGRYIIGFLHPAVDALGIESPMQAVIVRPGAPAVVDLSTPSPQRLFGALCPATSSSSTGALVGIVHDADAGTAIGGAKIVLTWNEVGIGARGIETVRRRIPVTARPDGSYLLCGASSNVDLVASAEAPARMTGLIEVRVPAGTLVRRDFSLGDSTSARAVAGDTGATISASGERGKVVRGTARLNGVVRGRNRAPVQGATVLVWGTGLTARTGTDGTFALSGLPAGTYSVEARAIGYAPGRVPVDLASNVTRATTVTLADPPTTARPSSSWASAAPTRERDRNGFLQRQKNGFGRYVTAEDIERRQPQYITDALRSIPGLQISPNGNGFGYSVSARGGCTPSVYIDGTPMMGGASDLDNFIRPGDVQGIEVYTSNAGMPAQYQGACAIAIWTK